MTIRRKFFIAFALILVTSLASLAVNGLVALKQFRLTGDMAHVSEVVAQEHLPLVEVIKNLQLDMSRMQAVVADIAAVRTAERLESGLQEVEDAAESFRHHHSAAPAPSGNDDMAVARSMQAELLPPKAELDWLAQRYGVRVSGFFETSCTLGGDIWGLDPLDDHRFILWLADFSGHGITAALNTFRLHTLLEHTIPDRERPAAFLCELNQRLIGLLPKGQYATMLYGVVDVRNRTYTYAAAAAPRPVVACPDQPPVPGDGSGLPLGVSRSAIYAERVLELPPGAALFLASDALQESPSESGAKLGHGGVTQLVGDVVTARAGKVDVDAILAPFLASVRRPLRDDLTAVCCVLA